MKFAERLLARRRFPLPRFQLAPLEFEADEAAGELLLDRVVIAGDGGANVVSLAKPIPTAGELHESIERHLKATRPAPADPAEELRSAMSDLRRSLG